MRRLRAMEVPTHSELVTTMRERGWLSKQPQPLAERILAAASFLEFAPGETISWAGDESSCIYGMIGGGVGVYASNDRNGPALTTIARTGTWFGISPLMRGGRRTLGFKAIDPTIVALVQSSEISTIVSSGEFSDFQMASIAEDGFEIASDIVCDLLIAKADQRIAATLLRATGGKVFFAEPTSAGFTLTQSDLAEMANASRNYVNRTLRRLYELGLIAKSYHHIRILDREGLSRFAMKDD